MCITDKIVDKRYTTGSEKYSSNSLLSHSGFNTTGRKGKKGVAFPVKKSRRPYKTFHPGGPRKVAANEMSTNAVSVLSFKDDGKEGSTDIVEVVSCEYSK